MTPKQIRQDALEFTRLLAGRHATDQLSFLVAQSNVAALYEIAAQLSEANELKRAEMYVAGTLPWPDGCRGVDSNGVVFEKKGGKRE